jgi:hypothetical protein
MVKGWWDRNFTLKGFLGLAMLLYSAIPDWIARNDFWRDKVHALGAFLLTPIGRLALVVSGIAIIWLDHRSASKKHSVRQLGKSFLPLGIKSARFGVDDNRYKDVTTQVRANIKNNRVNMLVSTNTLTGGADPFYGEVKHLIVEYFFGDGPIVHIVRREQDQLEIPESTYDEQSNAAHESQGRVVHHGKSKSENVSTRDWIGEWSESEKQFRKWEQSGVFAERYDAEWEIRSSDYTATAKAEVQAACELAGSRLFHSPGIRLSNRVSSQSSHWIRWLYFLEETEGFNRKIEGLNHGGYIEGLAHVSALACTKCAAKAFDT